jgi:hypothetical protein
MRVGAVMTAAIAAAALAACDRPVTPAPVREPAPAQTDAGAARAPASARIVAEVVFEGMCDASGAVPVSDRLLTVADDEDNVLRTYDADRGGPPQAAVDVSAALDLPLVGKKHPRPAEADLEDATRLGDRAFWLASHGRSKSGKRRPERLLLFATTVPASGAPLEVVGKAYGGLLDDLLDAPQLAAFDLSAAAALPPDVPGGLNIEGMTATPDHTLLLAFRNPVPEGKGLLVPIIEPERLVAGERARFGEPRLLDLDGLGIRGLSWWRGRYLIIAGHHRGEVASRLYSWPGHGPATWIREIDLAAYNPEALFTPEERDDVMLLSDDGEVVIDGKPCKRLADPSRKRFRAIRIALPE